jgi:hypothetical protein
VLNKYAIELQFTSEGVPVKVQSETVAHMVLKNRVTHTKEKVQGLLCLHHCNFPEVYSTINAENVMVVKVECCCEDFLKIVDTRFHV